MKLKEVADALERFAPLPLQESYDNAGLQIGLTESDISRVLLCLDITEQVIEEAIEKQCELIVSHHPLLFKGLKRISDTSYIERCVRMAIKNDINIYSAHTNLDNTKYGVNWEIAQRLRLKNIRFLLPNAANEGGSGIIAELPNAVMFEHWVNDIKKAFKIDCLMTNKGPNHPIKSIALCGGAGSFLLDEAVQQGADAFLTGEMSYHHFFGQEKNLHIGIMGHYQSEQFTIDLLEKVLAQSFPLLQIYKTEINTNPIKYL